MGLTMKEKKAVTKEQAKRYRRASRKEKGVMLNEFTALTGYNRTYASYVLSRHGREVKGVPGKVFVGEFRKKHTRKRESYYGMDVKKELIKIWEIMDYICGKRLAPVMSELVPKLIEHGELDISDEIKEKLLQISAPTIDRILKEERKKYQVKGRSGTKPRAVSLKH